jgi:hypothetical protein
MRPFLLVGCSILAAVLQTPVAALTPPRPPARSATARTTLRAETDAHVSTDHSSSSTTSASRHRRQVLASAVTGILSLGSTSCQAVVSLESNPKIFTPGQALGVQASKERLAQARISLAYLTDNYDTIRAGGGDNVRRYLGTVGTTSGLYGIMKVLKELQKEAEDIVEYTEGMSEFEYSLLGADTAAYSANFVEHSSAKTKPEVFFKDAKREIDNMKVQLDKMVSELNLS